MTAWLGRRSDPRVDYREPVRVIWPGEVSGVEGRAVNLSRTGILVDAPTPTPCEVGSELLCDLALPRHGSVLLRGRVAHRRLLSTAKVGMGIEFIDLSPDEAAELRGLVDAGDEKPQRVMVRFEGTDQTVRARAVATDAGFRLATSLSFLKVGTALEVSLAPGALPRATGRVSSVALDVAQSDGVPRLLIDVRVDGATSLDEDLTPVVETLIPSLQEAVPEIVQDEVAVALGEEERTQVVERTQMVDVPPKLRPGWALSFGMLAGVAGLAAFGPVLLRHVKPSPAPVAVAPPSPVVVEAPAPVAPSSPAVVEAPAPIAPPAAPVAAAPVAPAIAEPAPTPVAPHFTIGLKGSLAGFRRYFLRAPDGIAFNLPHAEATIGHGTYEAALPGVRAVWVRPLAGGGTNVRVFYTSARPAPQVTLAPEGITVVAATP
jgi:PilZ domain